MVGQAYAHTLLAAMKQETLLLFNAVSHQSKKAGIDHQEKLIEISQMIDDKRYATARVYLETLQERLPL